MSATETMCQDLKDIVKQYKKVQHDGSVMINGRRRSRRPLKPVTRFSVADENDKMSDDYDASEYDSDDSDASEVEDETNDSDYDPEAETESEDEMVLAVDMESEDESEDESD